MWEILTLTSGISGALFIGELHMEVVFLASSPATLCEVSLPYLDAIP